MSKIKIAMMSATVIAAAAALTGCGTMNNVLANKSTETEYFRVYDIATNAPPSAIGNAASNGIGKDVDDLQQVYPINTSGEIPAKPAYMVLANPFAGSSIGALASAAGSIGFKVSTCNGASWTAKSQKVVAGDDRQSFDLCLFPYRGGYQLDIYGDLLTQSGGINPSLLIARAVVNKALGSPKEFMDKAFADTLTSIHGALPSAKIAYVRGEPAPGPLPWISGTILGR